ncbi:TetR family transcriptional regulator [Mycobacterium intermedium]|uniref:TetR family transcriptional regulator n=1 Tax=Mycobacterium intermedium TaxID=28445 RepID=A0A1E3S5I8_MYCIE|nr:TetR-like C-terminal domain-containing protein [Mycobacterium intermedium]MCV6967354.1 TetR/AcrR family transcriptional regulator C-terminal ligand-binding domain-containing protein [Mycobacterium intermedium]ODQ97426.1 TetR family transcriptional regulator [Mycobacterium intermedium]OPE50458.1 TetR family transcriptional regulator [Mycobacterium intermedium]ORB08182.1 TetR family transcriptional regulator [Mycobacterium intermedium]
MEPSRPRHAAQAAIPDDVRARVLPAVLDELACWGVERFSVEAMAERHNFDPAIIYRYWGDRHRLIVDFAVGDNEALQSDIDTGSLRGDLLALARHVADRINTESGRTFVRALVMDLRGRHDQETRMAIWREQFAAARTILARARERGELRPDVNTLAAVQIVMAPLNVYALYSEEVIPVEYYTALADMAWHALTAR